MRDDRWYNSVAVGTLIAGVVIGVACAISLEQSTITLISGAVVGIAVAAPCAAVIAWVVMRQRNERKPQPPAPPVPQPPATQVTEQHLHIHLAPGQAMPTRGELLALLSRQTGSYEQARALIEAGRVTVGEDQKR